MTTTQVLDYLILVSRREDVSNDEVGTEPVLRASNGHPSLNWSLSAAVTASESRKVLTNWKKFNNLRARSRGL
jgi:hypothetical protein